MENYKERIPHVKFKPKVRSLPLYSTCYLEAEIDKKVNKGKQKEKVVALVSANNEEEHSTEEHKGGAQDESDDEDEFVDNDYEIRPKDDPEFDEVISIVDDHDFVAHVDNEDVLEEFADMGYAGEISDHSIDTEELRSLDESSESDNSEVTSKRRKKKVKGRTWVPARDLKDPHFEIGQVFADCTMFREAVKKFAVKTGYNLTFQKNTNKKIEVICGKQKGRREDRACPFWMYAGSISQKSPELVIKTLNLEHKNCPVVPRVKFCTSTFIGKEYAHVFKVDPYISRKGFQDRVRDDYCQNITHRQVKRARKLAAELNEGSEADQYNMLESYAVMLRETNPNSTVKMMTEMEGEVRKFKRFYVCLDACKRGWKEGCRPVIGLDGCHIKGNYPGQLLSAVGIDANNGMYPIAYAIVELENYETWTWFMEFVRVDLKINNGNDVMFMSDKQKGLLDAVADVVPG
ncbi:hypothetical protein M0R45_029896 [Rubus argutus]|uniref:MULE transposase domain-containing protein n=1 Tax=Rubus argutus TaxID=59490 RepID=A0AAW1WBK0_RUBAR